MGNQNTFALPSTLSTQNDHSLSPSIAHSFGQYNQHVQDHINKESKSIII